MSAFRWVFVASLFGLAGTASAAPLTVPFDFSKQAILLNVTVHGAPLNMLLDTGVDPSVIDIHRAETLKLPIDRKEGGELSGEGGAKEAQAFAATIDGLSIGGRSFDKVDALATDLSAVSKGYGRTVDGVLGYSFLSGKIVLIDYPARSVSILDRPADALGTVQTCARHWSIPMRFMADENFPLIPAFRFGDATAPATLDTGSNGNIAIYQSAFDLPGMTAALTEIGQAAYTGARGIGTGKRYRLDVPVGFGPFLLPKGQIVTTHPEKGSADTREANIGNAFFAAATPVMLLDYKNRETGFYGACR